MNRSLFKNIEWKVLFTLIILLIIGLVALFSATKNSNYDEFKKQIIWIAISIPISYIIITIDYKNIVKFWYVFYLLFIILLVAVLFTKPINGARSWFKIGSQLFQPSEFMKIVSIITMAQLICIIKQRYGNDAINKPLLLLVFLVVSLIPVALIILQPDYGTAIGYMLAIVLMLFIAGIKKRYIIAAALILVISLPLLYIFVLPSHAKARINVFLNPELDAKGAGYNAIQSKLAIGSGQILGQGLFKGNQTQLGFLYPKTTDFIYPVVCEEMGFIMGATVILTYVFLITKSVYIAKTARDTLGSYIAIGIVGILLFHFVENIGMTIGLLPITGVPLPFISYGGSSLLTNIIMISLIINISGRRKKVLYME